MLVNDRCLENKNKQTEKIGTSEMSLVTNSPLTLYPFPFLHEVNIRITSPSTTIYGHSSFFLSLFFFCFLIFFQPFSLIFFVQLEQNGAILNDNPCMGLFHNKSHYKVDKLFTDRMTKKTKNQTNKTKKQPIKSLSKHVHMNCHHLPSVLRVIHLRLAE